MPLHPLSGKHIVIAGAGIAGLSFARSLTHSWPSDTAPPRISVYERDPRDLPVERGNYSLGLRSDGGMQALRELGVLDAVVKACVPESNSGFMVRNAAWQPLVTFREGGNPPDGLPYARLRITRGNLRECLIRSLPDDMVNIYWGVGCTSACPLEKSEGAEVRLSDDTIVSCDLLVVADGASSKLRGHLLPNESLNFAGVVSTGGNAVFTSADEVPSELQQGWGMSLGGDGHGLVVLPIDNKLQWVWFLTSASSVPGTPISGNAALANKAEIIADVLKEGAVFGPTLKQLVDATNPSTLRVFNAQDKSPIQHEAPTFLGSHCYFIGDANHAMSPFAGNGANMAIVDGLKLGQLLSNATSITTAAVEFDRDCVPRCASSIKKSHWMISVVHSAGWRYWLSLLFLQVLNLFVGSRRS